MTVSLRERRKVFCFLLKEKFSKFEANNFAFFYFFLFGSECWQETIVIFEFEGGELHNSNKVSGMRNWESLLCFESRGKISVSAFRTLSFFDSTPFFLSGSLKNFFYQSCISFLLELRQCFCKSRSLPC